MLLLEVLFSEAPFSWETGDTKYCYNYPQSWVIKYTNYLGRYVLTQLKDIKNDSGNILKVQKSTFAITGHNILDSHIERCWAVCFETSSRIAHLYYIIAQFTS